MADIDGLELLEEIKAGVIRGDIGGLPELTQNALDGGLAPETVMNGGLISAMAVVGDKFEKKEYFVPEVLVSARAMEAALTVLRPLLESGNVQPLGRIAVGTVKGDLHDIGKNIVAMVLTGAGFEVENLGTDVSPDSFVEAAAGGAQVIGMSSLLTTTRPVMGEVVRLLEERGLRGNVKVVLGGAAVTEKFSEEVGADAYGADANDAVRKVKGLLGVPL
jgi:5-methyltetrahydrofolate--homocysteine methyltransferase